jgi:hypothetical protein
MKLGSPDSRRVLWGRPKWAVSAVAATLAVGLGGLAVGIDGLGGAGAAKPVGAPIPSAPCSGAATTPTTDLVTTPATCHGTATLQAQVDTLTATVNSYRTPCPVSTVTTSGTKKMKAICTAAADKTDVSGGSVGPSSAVDYGLETLWLEGIDGNGVTVAVMEEWNTPQAATVLARESTRDHLPWTASQIRTIFPEETTPTHGSLATVKSKPVADATGGPHVTVHGTKTTETKVTGVETTTCPQGMVILGTYGSCSAWQGELQLDIETVHMFAPYAKIVVSATPADSQITDDAAFNVAAPELLGAVAYIAQHHIAQTISISDGTSETTYLDGWATLTAQNIDEEEAAADGVPVLVATGDCGVVQNLATAASQCGTGSTTAQTSGWNDSPWTVAVGGSKPHVTKGVKTENDTLTSIEAAGFSALYPKPAYQDAVNPSTQRSVPTITLDSSDGTSQAAPGFNGVLALATQLLNVGNNGPEKLLGPIATALYKIGPEGAAAGIVNITTGSDGDAAQKTTATVAVTTQGTPTKKADEEEGVGNPEGGGAGLRGRRRLQYGRRVGHRHSPHVRLRPRPGNHHPEDRGDSSGAGGSRSGGGGAACRQHDTGQRRHLRVGQDTHPQPPGHPVHHNSAGLALVHDRDGCAWIRGVGLPAVHRVSTGVRHLHDHTEGGAESNRGDVPCALPGQAHAQAAEPARDNDGELHRRLARSAARIEAIGPQWLAQRSGNSGWRWRNVSGSANRLR